jgi:hypothetical protein
MQTFQLHLPDQFLAACAHYELQPEEVLQQFLNSANFPGVREPKGDLYFAASLFLLEYIGSTGHVPSRHTHTQRIFLEIMAQDRVCLLQRIRNYSHERQQKAIGRYFQRFWKLWKGLSLR